MAVATQLVRVICDCATPDVSGAALLWETQRYCGCGLVFIGYRLSELKG